MEEQTGSRDRVYYAQRAVEEFELAQAATDSEAADVHRRLQRAYLERASVGERQMPQPDLIG